MAKKLFLLAATMLFAAQVWAYDFSEVCSTGQTLYYKINGNDVMVTYPGTYYYSPYSGFAEPTGDLVIPSSVIYNGTNYNVVSIGRSAFNDCSGLTSVTIPSSVTYIGEDAFNDCTGLTSITLPNIDSIETGTFGGSGLTSITIPESVVSIGLCAFQACSALTSVTMPKSSLISIGNQAFDLCTGLTSITIPNSVTSIGDLAFFMCQALPSITIPSSVTSIGVEAFRGCVSLQSIVVEDGNTDYDSRDNCNAIIETQTNTLIAGCPTTVIPNTVTSIGFAAFMDQIGLTSITIPNSVVSIEVAAFSYCSGLTSITIPNSVVSIGFEAFSHCTGLTSITIPDSILSIGAGAFSYCTGLTSITIPNSVFSIEQEAFRYCTGLTSLTIGSSVTSIGNLAFADCPALSVITLNSSIPPLIQYDTFHNVSTGLQIHVPCSSVPAYQSVQYWSDFTNILDIVYEFSCQSNHTWLGSTQILTVPTCANGGWAQIQAIPTNDAVFVKWSDGNIDNPHTLTVTQDTTLIAIFESLTSVNENDIPENIFILSNSENVTVSGAEGVNVKMYDTTGRLLFETENAQDILRIGVRVKGVYIVKVGNYRAKKTIVL